MVLSVAITAAATAGQLHTAAPQTMTTGCVLTPGFQRTVTGIVDPDTVTLDDGSELRLAGTIGPRALDAAASIDNWPPETEAIAALAALVLGRTVDIHPMTPRTDRYRRLVAHVFVARDGRRMWVQGDLIAEGHARAYGMGDTAHCAGGLIALERDARAAKRGLWAHAAYFERASYRTRELMRLRSTFQIVSGRVRKVAEMKSATYLNFGTDWRSDFTAGLKLGKGELTLPEFNAMVRALEGRRVRVRGWIDRRNGPYIEIAHPSELEVLDEGPPGQTEQPATVAGANEKRPER
ncbi:MAG: thermonuclease family protein [Hyphomicrobium sp.]